MVELNLNHHRIAFTQFLILSFYVSQCKDPEVLCFKSINSKKEEDILHENNKHRIMRVSPFLFLQSFNRIQPAVEGKHRKTKGP